MAVPLRLLILEDRATDAELALHQLRRAGFAPLYDRVETKYEYLAHLDPTLDLILADYSLPNFDALSALELLQESRLDIPFIIFSGSIGEDTAVSALKRGADDYLLKDRLTRLGSAVEQALERRRHRQENRRAEQALRVSEERFRALIEHSWDGLLLVSPTGEISYASPSTQRIMGHAGDEMISQNVFALIHNEDRPPVVERFQMLLEQPKGTINLELRYRHKNGAWRSLDCSITNLLGAPGVGALVVNYRDITERKLAEAALRESEEHYRLLFDSNPHPMWVYDLETLAFLAVNHSAVCHYGYTREEFLAMTIKDIRPPERVASFPNNINKTGAVFDVSGSWRHQKKDGTLIDVEISSHLLSFGEKSARLVLATDVTERLLVEAEQTWLLDIIGKSAVEWQMTFDAIESPVLILDGVGRVTKLNRAAKELSGGSYPELAGQPIELLGSSPLWPTAAELVNLIRNTRVPEVCQARDEASERTWDVAASLASGPEGDDERIILVIREVTRIVDLQASLHRSETMSLLGTLVSGVAHEVRNPLFGISTTLDAFEARFGIKEEYESYLGVLRGQVDRLSDLMKDLLEYGRPISHELTPGHIGEIITRAVQACQPLARQAKVRIVNRANVSLPLMLMDQKRLPQVFLNLLENAIQHLPPDGQVSIEAVAAQHEGKDWVVCVIKDTGPGFQAEDLPHLFEPFFTRRRGGTGLGLSIVQRLVEAHEGKISVSNCPEGGAMVTLRFPVSTPQLEMAKMADMASKKGSNLYGKKQDTVN